MRTGSSWLCSLLDSHPQVGCMREIMHRTRYKGKMGSARSYINETLSTIKKPVKGFKILYHQLRGIDNTAYAIFKYLVNDVYKCKVIHIVRNELDVYISHRRAVASKIWNIYNNSGKYEAIHDRGWQHERMAQNTIENCDLTKQDVDHIIKSYNKDITVDLDDFKIFLQRYRIWKNEIAKSFDVLEVNYDELPNIHRICSILNIDHVKTEGKTIKLSRHYNITNIDEVLRII